MLPVTSSLWETSSKIRPATIGSVVIGRSRVAASIAGEDANVDSRMAEDEGGTRSQSAKAVERKAQSPY